MFLRVIWECMAIRGVLNYLSSNLFQTNLLRREYGTFAVRQFHPLMK